jgi:nitrous oxidase accessory protein
MLREVVAAVVAAPVVAALGAATLPAIGATLDVPTTHATLPSALAASAPDDTVHVHGGVHEGGLTLRTPVTLLGSDEPVLRGTGRGDVLVLAAPGCRVQGFLIERSGTDMAPSDAGIRILSDRNHILGNRIRHCLFGMYFEHADSNVVTGNEVEGMTERDQGERGSGIHLFDSHDNRFEDDVVLDARDGIYFDHANRNTVVGSSFTGARYGLHYMYSDDNVFAENRFSDCTAGATIMFTRRVLFRGNWFVSNRGFSSVGALLKDCYDSEAVENLFADNSTALLLDNSMHNVFRRNHVLRNDVALFLFSGSDDNLFTENNFVENLSPIRLLGRTTTTRWAAAGRGNHWSEYDGYDLDGDGTGDVPHRIQNVFEFLESEHPPLRFFLVSPAAAAMKSGEEAFPLFEWTREVDPSPLVKPVAVPLGERWRLPPSRPHRLPAASACAGIASALAVLAWSRRLRISRSDRP